MKAAGDDEECEDEVTEILQYYDYGEKMSAGEEK